MLGEGNGPLETIDPSGLSARRSKSTGVHAAAHGDELRRLDLVDNIAELGANSLTVVPPGLKGPGGGDLRLRYGWKENGPRPIAGPYLPGLSHQFDGRRRH